MLRERIELHRGVVINPDTRRSDKPRHRFIASRNRLASLSLNRDGALNVPLRPVVLYLQERYASTEKSAVAVVGQLEYGLCAVDE